MPVELLDEPSAPQGPLIALGRLMDHHSSQPLLLCTVDMLVLDLATLWQPWPRSGRAPFRGVLAVIFNLA